MQTGGGWIWKVGLNFFYLAWFNVLWKVSVAGPDLFMKLKAEPDTAVCVELHFLLDIEFLKASNRPQIFNTD